MSEVSDRTKSARTTGSMVFRTLGILVGTATCVSLIRHGLEIELHGLPMKMLHQYTALRDALFWPIVELLRVTIPWWLKDFTMAYCLMGAAHSRGLDAFNSTRPIKDALSYQEALALILIWPAIAGIVIGLSLGAGEEDRVISRRLGKMILLELLIVVGTAFLFFLWNHLQNAFGPGG